MAIDSIGDFLTIIRNGVMSSKSFVIAPYSTLKFEIANILKDEGFVRNSVVIEENEKKFIKVFLKYVDGESVIHELNRVSTPGRREYKGVSHIKPVIGGLGVSILTTNKGVITNKKAKEFGVGGEVICTVW
jgi:small subunit ribosomal protein S8